MIIALTVALCIAILLNVTATMAVARIPELTKTQRTLQIALVWLIPVLGAVVCIAFASSQVAGVAKATPHDPLYLPGDGAAPEGGVGLCGCGGASDGGGASD